MMKTKIKKVNLVNRRGKITGSVVVKETELKPCMDVLYPYFDMFFVRPRIPIVMEVIKSHKKRVKNDLGRTCRKDKTK